MEKKKVTLDLREYEELKLVSKIAEKNGVREALQYLHYDPEHKCVEVCDGNLLRRVYVDLGSKDFLIHPDSFILPVPALRKRYGGGSFEVELDTRTNLEYPYIDQVIPTEGSCLPGIGLDSGGLQKLCSTYPRGEKGKTKPLYFYLSSPLGGVRVYSKPYDGGETMLTGLIMPYRAPEDVEADFKATTRDYKAAARAGYRKLNNTEGDQNNG